MYINVKSLKNCSIFKKNMNTYLLLYVYIYDTNICFLKIHTHKYIDINPINVQQFRIAHLSYIYIYMHLNYMCICLYKYIYIYVEN
jgi:hypothetical protein